jgi:hypothetical protein
MLGVQKYLCFRVHWEAADSLEQVSAWVQRVFSNDLMSWSVPLLSLIRNGRYGFSVTVRSMHQVGRAMGA